MVRPENYHTVLALGQLGAQDVVCWIRATQVDAVFIKCEGRQYINITPIVSDELKKEILERYSGDDKDPQPPKPIKENYDFNLKGSC